MNNGTPKLEKIIAYELEHKIRIVEHSNEFYSLRNNTGGTIYAGTLQSVRDYVTYVLDIGLDTFTWGETQTTVLIEPTPLQLAAIKLQQIAILMNEVCEIWGELPEEEYHIIDQYSPISRDTDLIRQDFNNWANNVSKELERNNKKFL